jgi:hypothetical protein
MPETTIDYIGPADSVVTIVSPVRGSFFARRPDEKARPRRRNSPPPPMQDLLGEVPDV